MAERVQVRELGDDEGQRLLRILRRGSGSVATWRRAHMLLLSAQGMPVPQIAEVTCDLPPRPGQRPRHLQLTLDVHAALTAPKRP